MAPGIIDVFLPVLKKSTTLRHFAHHFTILSYENCEAIKQAVLRNATLQTLELCWASGFRRDKGLETETAVAEMLISLVGSNSGSNLCKLILQGIHIPICQQMELLHNLHFHQKIRELSIGFYSESTSAVVKLIQRNKNLCKLHLVHIERPIGSYTNRVERSWDPLDTADLMRALAEHPMLKSLSVESGCFNHPQQFIADLAHLLRVNDTLEELSFICNHSQELGGYDSSALWDALEQKQHNTLRTFCSSHFKLRGKHADRTYYLLKTKGKLVHGVRVFVKHTWY
jgi:hypothetical protein